VPYVNSLDNPFIWDDSNAIVNNPTIRSLWPLWKPLLPPAETPVATRPLVNLSFALNYALHGLDVRGYHLVNLGLHLLTACLLFAIVHRALSTGTSNTRSHVHVSLTALLATLVWAVHPMVSEVVNYTTQRSDALGGLFLVLTLFAAQRALGAVHRGRWHVIAAIACACGVLSKEFVAVAPLIVLLYDRVFAFRSFREAFAVRKSLYRALAATWIPLGAILVLRPHSTIGFAAGVDPWTYALNQAQMIGRYLRQAVWPDALVLDYGLPRPLSLGTVWVSAVLITTLFAASIVALFRWPRVGFLCVVFFILLAPTSSFIPITTEVGAERRMYLALAALTILVVAGGAWVIDRVRPRLPRRVGDVLPAAAVAAAVAWVGTLGVLTTHRNAEFAMPVTLWRGSVERWPQGRARILYAEALGDAGDHASAIHQLQLAVRDLPKARSTLGRELAAAGRHDEAARELSAFIAAEPRAEDQQPARMLLASVFVDTGRFDEATAEFRRLVEQFPSDPVPRERLAGILIAHGHAAEAAVQYRELMRQVPNNAVWQARLARALAFSGRLDEAEGAYRQALRIDPRTVEALSGLAAVLFETGRTAEAAVHAEAALALDPRDAPSHNIFGAARAIEGHTDEAIAHFKQAIAIDSNYTEARNNLARAERQLEASR
jgi:tetratricopeptide (TPR) repeat protein